MPGFLLEKFTLSSAARTLEAIGRAVVDFGFSGVIEKFEEHWGRRATKSLLLLIGLAVVAISVGAIWTYLLSPLVQLVSELIPDHPSPHARSIAKFVVFLAFALMAVNIGLSYFNRWQESRLNWNLLNRAREAKRLLHEAQERNATSQGRLDEAKVLLANAEERAATANENITRLEQLLEVTSNLSEGLAGAMEAVLQHAVKKNMLTPEQAAELDAFSNEWLPESVRDKIPK